MSVNCNSRDGTNLSKTRFKLELDYTIYSLTVNITEAVKRELVTGVRGQCLSLYRQCAGRGPENVVARASLGLLAWLVWAWWRGISVVSNVNSSVTSIVDRYIADIKTRSKPTGGDMCFTRPGIWSMSTPIGRGGFAKSQPSTRVRVAELRRKNAAILQHPRAGAEGGEERRVGWSSITKRQPSADDGSGLPRCCVIQQMVLLLFLLRRRWCVLLHHDESVHQPSASSHSLTFAVAGRTFLT
jgi:hypothetical protein